MALELNIRKPFKLVFKVIAGVFILLLVSLVLLLWRLSSSPVQFNQFVPNIEQAASQLPGGLSVRLNGIELYWNRSGGKIDLRLVGVELVELSGDSIVSSPEIDVSLSVSALTRGVVALSSVDLIDVNIQVVRNEDGSYRIQKNRTETRMEQTTPVDDRKDRDFTGVIQHVFKQLVAEPDPASPLSYLKRVKIEGSIQLEDRKTGINWNANTVESLFISNRDKIEGDLQVAFSAPDALVGTRAEIDLTLKNDVVEANLEVTGLRPSGFAQFDSRLAGLSGVDMTFDGTISTSMTLPDKIHQLKVDIQSGNGSFSHAEFYPEALKVKSLDLQLNLDLADKTVEVSGLDLSLGEAGHSLQVNLSADAQIHESSVSVSLAPVVNQLRVDDMDLYWPRGIASGARRWLVNNLSVGSVDKATLDLAMVIPTQAETDFQLIKLDGTMDYSGLTVSYFGSLPPATAVSGSGTFDQQGFDLGLAKGAVNGISIESGKVVISGLVDKKAAISVVTHLTGELIDVFKVLEAPPIALDPVSGFDSDQLKGQVDTEFRIALPLRAGLSKEEILYSADGKISGGAIQKLLGDHGVEAMNVDVKLNPSIVRFDGSLELDGVPMTVDWSTQLVGEARLQSECKLEAQAITAADFDDMGFQVSQYMKGSLALTTAATLFPGGVLKATVQSDLANADLGIPEIFWNKALGDSGRIDFELHFRDNQLRFEDIQIDLGEVRGSGNVGFDIRNNQLQLEMGHVSLPIGTLKTLEFKRTDSELQLSVQGGELNLESYLSVNKQKDAISTSYPSAKTTANRDLPKPVGLVVDIKNSKLDKVYVNGDTYLDNIQFSARYDNKGWHEFNFSGHNPFEESGGGAFAGRTRETARLKQGEFLVNFGPLADARYPLRIEVENTGALVTAIKGRQMLNGGYLVITGHSAGPLMQNPIQADFKVDHFTVKEVPAFSTILNMASLTQIVSTFKQTGLAFNSLSGDIELDGTRFSSKQMRTNGGSLGFLVGGWIDTKEKSMDAKGTVVPLHKINNLVGKIPVLGKVVVGDDGKGIIAFDFAVKGSLEDPEVTVNKNPLNPHLLKNLMDLSEEESETRPQ